MSGLSSTLQGAIWMIGTIISFSVMAVSGRELASDLDTFEVMMYRSAVGLLIVIAVISANRSWHEIRTQRPVLHGLRNIGHFVGQNLWFLAVGLVPLSQVFALEFTTPIWVILLGPLLLGERITLVRAICAALGFAGVLIVARPGSLGLETGVIAAASAAIFFALSIILTKRLTRTETITCIMFYLTAMQLVLGVLSAGYDGDVAVPRADNLPFVIAIAVGGLVAHFCYTKALSLAPATVVTPLDFARLPMIAVIAFVLYAEQIDPLVFLGAAIIFAGNYLNIWTETRKTPT